MSVDVCIHVANLLYLASYLCRDILWLRVLTCLGLGFGIVFFCARTEAMFTPAAWMGVFLIVNLVQIALIVRERRAQQLSPEQTELGKTLFEHLSREDMLNLLTWSLCEGEQSLALLEQCDEIELNLEQQVVRDLAFARLSDQELMNLLIRRFWRSLRTHERGALDPVRSSPENFVPAFRKGMPSW